MKSVILDLDEDLNDEQIDTIIRKLQSKKKNQEPPKPKVVLTKNEQTLLNKVRKHISDDYSYSTLFDPDEMDAGLNWFKEVIISLTEDMKNMSIDLQEEVNIVEDDIESRYEDIVGAKEDIKSYEKDLLVHKKRLEAHKKVVPLVKQLEKEFAKRKKK